MFVRQPLKLDDCAVHGAGSGAELFIVEGDSAAGAVSLVRNAEYQAVLPMMGKPLNAVKASLNKVQTYPLFMVLAEAIGAGMGATFDVARVRYDRVVLLMDADADGIHCGALMCLYFHRMMRPLLDGGFLWMAYPPIVTMSADGRESRHVYSDAEYRAACVEWRASGTPQFNTVRYRGLAGLDHFVLASTCVHPGTRALRAMNGGDADAALAVFGGTRPNSR